jgi:hypothetical protein
MNNTQGKTRLVPVMALKATPIIVLVPMAKA